MADIIGRRGIAGISFALTRGLRIRFREGHSFPRGTIMNSCCGKKGIRNIAGRHRPASLLVVLLVLAGFPAIAAAEGEKPAAPENTWSVELYLKRYIGSHTSYEFGNPDPPYQSPLSRLEFPLNTWWAGGEVRRNFPRISAGLEVLRNVTRESDGSFEDSDWDDDTRPTVKSVYSDLSCRMEPSYMVRADLDLKVADWLGLPAGLDLRPVVGVRWQRLELLAHDGVQVYPAPGDTTPPDPLPGAIIRFKQHYWQYFIGLRTAYDLGRHIPWPRLKLQGQLDWAYVYGENSDRHLLREGIRMTYERTRGHAWHASLGVKTGLVKNLHAGVEAEYLLIRTTGSHQWVHDIENVDQSWDDGVKVWSEQMSLKLSLEYLF